MARPTYEPTPADRETVKALSAAGVPQDRIARCLGVYGIDAKSLRKHFRRELDITRDQFTAHVMGKFKQACDRGESWAIMSWLKCQAGWHEPAAVEHFGAIDVQHSLDARSIRRIIDEVLANHPEAKRDVARRLIEIDAPKPNGRAS